MKYQSTLNNKYEAINAISFDLILGIKYPYLILIEAKKRHITVNDKIETNFQLEV